MGIQTNLGTVTELFSLKTKLIWGLELPLPLGELFTFDGCNLG